MTLNITMLSIIIIIDKQQTGAKNFSVIEFLVGDPYPY